MRLAVTASGVDLSSPIDTRFGRARYLLVVDMPGRSFQPIDNHKSRSAAEGAGVNAAQNVIDTASTALITGHCGPKAFRALKAADIDVYLAPGGMVSEALDLFEAGKLERLAGANVDGHW